MNGPNARLEGDQSESGGLLRNQYVWPLTLTSRIRITLIKYVPISLSKDSCMVCISIFYPQIHLYLLMVHAEIVALFKKYNIVCASS
jgi:hypothetical protein